MWMTFNVLQRCRVRGRRRNNRHKMLSVLFLLAVSIELSIAFGYVSLPGKKRNTFSSYHLRPCYRLHHRSTLSQPIDSTQRNGDVILLWQAVDLSEAKSSSNQSIDYDDNNSNKNYNDDDDDDEGEVRSSLVLRHVNDSKDTFQRLQVNGDPKFHPTSNGFKVLHNSTTKSLNDTFQFPSVIPVITSGSSSDGAFFNITRISTESLVSNFENAKTLFIQKSSETISSTSQSTTSALFAGQQFALNATTTVTAPLRNLYRSAIEQAKAIIQNTTFLFSDNGLSDLDDSDDENVAELEPLSLRRLWRRRHARTLEEGIRREKATELSDLLNRAQIDVRRPEGRRYVERTLMGLINALAEEVEDLDIEFTTKAKTPFWRKEVKEIRINFSRLGFKPIRMGGSDKYDRKGNAIIKETTRDIDEGLSLVESADEAFDRIDKDKSGTLDQGEIAEALSMISELETDKESIDVLASELVNLYDVNSDGVVDREEYQQMVEDMAKLRPNQVEVPENNESPLKKVKDSVQSISKGISERAAQVAAKASGSDTPDFDPNEREMGSIILSDLNLDLRRLVFGGVPLVKRITPGGPLILEPFTATIRGSFTREDFMGSFLLDAGLRLLVARAIRVRLRSFRDVVDGAYFFGRKWTLKSKAAPAVQVLGLSNIEFSGEKVILTGRARIRTSPDAPVVTNTFKVRTKFGTGNNGQIIGLREPELAFVFECPQAWENGYVS